MLPFVPDNPIQGDQNALIILTEYADFECPYCRKALRQIKKIQKYFYSRLQFVFCHFPLTEIHPHAEMAAEAAEFAATRHLFWEMHDLLFENQAHLDHGLLLKLGEQIGLPVDELAKAIEQKQFQRKICGDFMSGVKKGVIGTPTFFINENKFNGSFFELPGEIDSALIK